MKIACADRYAILIILFMISSVQVVCGADDSDSKNQRAIMPLHGRIESEKNVDSSDVENMDQCAGTLRRYTFPPSGYEPPAPTSGSKRGQALYKQMNCAQCHSVQGAGGELGPPLDGIGGHRGREWLVARLIDPELQMKEFADVFDGRKNVMPHPGVNKRQAKQIADYLLTLAEPDAGYLVTAHQGLDSEKKPNAGFQPHPVDESVKRGAKIFVQMYCASCHTTDGGGHRVGPDLQGIGARLSDSDLDKVLKGAVKSSTMKAVTLGLEEDELKDLKAFLLSLP